MRDTVSGAAQVGPIAGLRVLELARILAGPWAGQLLADLGADVIKVEHPGEGDDTRRWGPPFLQGEDGAELGAAYFHSCNRGKRSVAIDISTAQGQARLFSRRWSGSASPPVPSKVRTGSFCRDWRLR